MARVLLLSVFLVVFGWCGLSTISRANHIVGGEISMKPVAGQNSFEVTLIQFWDENNLKIGTPTVGGNRDATVTLYIYRKRNNELLDSVQLNYQSSNSITYQNRACSTVRSLKTLQGIYSGTLTLPPSDYSDSQGYYMVWERCCRNDDINNIKDPGDTGMVFYMEFPPVSLSNSSPEFQFPNGQYICVNRAFTMNMSAIDADGDELKYSLVTPYRGNTTALQTVGNANKKNGYPLVTWENGISVNNIIPGPAPLSVNQKTGVLSVTAGRLGLYVFTIQCEEYRNGTRIGLVRRDFQLLVIDCSYDTPEAPVVMVKSIPVSEVKICPEQPVQLQTASSPDWAYQWQLNGLNLLGATSDQIMVQDTGSYTVVKSYNKKCSRDTASSPIRVSYADPVAAKITIDKRIICENDSASLIANGGQPIPVDYTYLWTRDNITIAENKINTSANAPGLYKLFIKNTVLGCTGQDTVTVSADLISVTLPDQINVQKGAKISVTAVVKPPGEDFTSLWSPVDAAFQSDPSLLTAFLEPTNDTTYTIEVNSVNGCKSKSSVRVSVYDRLYIPAAFSPDKDGKNETFQIFNGEKQIEEVNIYNRWGQVVFHSKGYSVPWNGNFNGQILPPGVYPYRIKTSHGDFRGEVMLLR
jgi:gliding motility-associated-like protein